MLACILGTLWGIHFTLILFICFCRLGIFQQTLLGPDRMQLILQWSCYVVFLSTFHLLEFFITALYNPYVTSADSFLVNHSIAYTTAALVRGLPLVLGVDCRDNTHRSILLLYIHCRSCRGPSFGFTFGAFLHSVQCT